MGVLLAKTLVYGFLDTYLLIHQREGRFCRRFWKIAEADVLSGAEEAVAPRTRLPPDGHRPGGSAVCRRGLSPI